MCFDAAASSCLCCCCYGWCWSCCCCCCCRFYHLSERQFFHDFLAGVAFLCASYELPFTTRTHIRSRTHPPHTYTSERTLSHPSSYATYFFLSCCYSSVFILRLSSPSRFALLAHVIYWNTFISLWCEQQQQQQHKLILLLSASLLYLLLFPQIRPLYSASLLLTLPVWFYWIFICKFSRRLWAHLL